MSKGVWLGTPQARAADESVLNDPYTSKLGGAALLFRHVEEPLRGGGGGAAGSYFRCPKCRSAAHVSLLAQLYAPLDVFDRVLYILMCTGACCTSPSAPSAAAADGAGGPSTVRPPPSKRMTEEEKLLQMPTKTPFCFALRSQNFSEAYYQEQEAAIARLRKARDDAAEAENKTSGGFLFDETDDWGDDAEPSETPAPAPAPPPCAGTAGPSPAEAAVERLRTYPLARTGTAAPIKGRAYTNGLPLDLFEEPAEPPHKSKTVEEDAEEAVRRYGEGAALDTTCVETDTETLQEKYVRKYMEQMELVPSQCVRCCPRQPASHRDRRPCIHRRVHTARRRAVLRCS
ncbi:pre-rRNA-processing protein TSR4 [Strigomonas culicis]|uniref:Pre-rRNA-processing protein TSR4 n=1 Tax=Strigomonas culicis TaxID=28005 RepID=S9U330_9TRYP|nr:pre-rRNA-processing protein TSR4 [Strigomonas culicis]|eukprot:EPY25197.1 pre-rRNA-processing protein TSR4 [Strigomonas culicis]